MSLKTENFKKWTSLLFETILYYVCIKEAETEGERNRHINGIPVHWFISPNAHPRSPMWVKGIQLFESSLLPSRVQVNKKNGVWSMARICPILIGMVISSDVLIPRLNVHFHPYCFESSNPCACIYLDLWFLSEVVYNFSTHIIYVFYRFSCKYYIFKQCK